MSFIDPETFPLCDSARSSAELDETPHINLPGPLKTIGATSAAGADIWSAQEIPETAVINPAHAIS
jgi:hypothetical protein